MAGKVVLVGAGPGGAALLTLKGRHELERAEVVVYDRLVDEEILRMIPDTAERIDVGKNVANHPVPQPQINRILLEKALEGRRVVRLKGGDCFVFGRGGEELELLAEHGVPFEVVPGITSALAAPAYAGIPVTHRDFCASVHVITGHRRSNESLELDYEALVRLRGTLIFLMSVATFGEIAQGLMQAGLDADFPCAIVENGARPEQRKYLTTIGDAAQCVEREGVRSPAIFVVGRVCELSPAMDWFDALPLKGLKVWAARPRKDSARLSTLLSERGARVEQLPPPAVESLCFALPAPGETVLLPVEEAVDALFAALNRAGLDARALAGCRLACCADAARALEKRGLHPDFCCSGRGAQALAEEACAAAAVLLCREDEAESLAQALPDVGVRAAWRILPPKPLEVLPDRADWIAFPTASCVEHFTRAVAGRDLSGLRAACIGPCTAEAARRLGLQVFQSQQPTLESLADLLASLRNG